MKKVIRIAEGVLLAWTSLAILSACDQVKPFAQQKNSAEPRQAMSIIGAGGKTFLLSGGQNKVFVLNDGEFVEVPIVKSESFSGQNGKQLYNDEVTDLNVYTSLKFRDGKLLYQVSVFPIFTPEYLAYLGAVRKDPKTVAPENKYKNPNWASLLLKPTNQINVALVDADGFEIARLYVPVSGGLGIFRTNVVEADGKTSSSVRYSGTIEMTGPQFSQIKATSVTYVLD